MYFIDANYTNASTYVSVYALQFYGRQLEALIPPMTSNTTPMGVASASSSLSANPPYMAFYKHGSLNNSTNVKYWVSTASGTYHWLEYKFGNIYDINELEFIHVNGYDAGTHTIKVYYLDSDENKILIDSFTKTGQYLASLKNYSFPSVKASGIRFESTVPTNNTFQIGNIQVYGTPDYESRTYIYDHGVEVMPITAYASKTAATVSKNTDELYGKFTSASDIIAQFYTNTVNMTNYKIIRAKAGNQLFTNGDSYFELAAGSTAPTTYEESGIKATLTVTATNLPNGICVDINSITQSLYPIIFENATTTARTRTFTIAEWWLE